MDDELARRMGELRDLGSVVNLLTWDQETFMPPGGAEARGQQLAAMQALLHERMLAPALGDLLAREAHSEGDRGAAVRNLTRDRNRAMRVPERLVRELAERQTLAVEAWKTARKESRFASFAPHLARLLELRREEADAIGHEGERYDALLEAYEPGMRVARLEPLLDALSAALVPIVDRLTAAPPPRRFSTEGRRFPQDAQWALTVTLLERMGFDLTRGRQDRSAHPFSDGIHPTDVRLTTRLRDSTPFPAIFGTIHEGGHGLYEQNLPLAHARDAMGTAASVGLHESQSRLWENLVGRSLPFWRWFQPAFVKAFPDAAGATAEELHAAVNRVERTPIRVEADEITYNLHILLRFRLELSMLRGDLPIADLPAAWNEGMRTTLGLVPENDAMGVLQDIHWAQGAFGYFPTYVLGNLYAATLHAALDRAIPDREARVAAGDLAPIRLWLGEHVHAQGHRFEAEEIVRRATGQGLDAEPFLTYLRGKYGPLYGVSL